MRTLSWEAWRSLIVCQVWAHALFLPTLAGLTPESNRYFVHWSTVSLLLNLAAVIALGLLLFVLGALVRRLWPAYYGRVAGAAAVTTLIFLAQALLHEWCPPLYAIAVLTPVGIGMAVLITAMLNRRGLGLEWVHQKLARAALLLWFLPVLFWLNCWRYPTYPRRDYPALEAVADRPTSGALFPAENVYIFVFDAWSHRLTFREDGSVRDELPALQALAREACVFDNGHSPGAHTVMSLPRLLFQRDEPFVLHQGQPGFWKDGLLPCSELPHVFSYARDGGFRTYMVGWHHPYFTLLGDRCDYVYAIPAVQLVGNSLADRAGAIYWHWARQLSGPVLSKPLHCADYLQHNQALYWQSQDLLRHARTVLADERPAGQFAVMHLPLPHGPFIYTREGVRDLNVYYSQSLPIPAAEQLGYLDQVIGEFLAELRRLGKYDNSIIVLTSDHTWREDPQLAQTGSAYSHVPLFIRFPGQDRPVRVTEPFTTSRLLALFDQVRLSEGRWGDLGHILAGQNWYQTVADEELPKRLMQCR